MPISPPLPPTAGIHDIEPSPYADFRLEEQNPETIDERVATVRSHLRATWPVQTDTLVTGELPLLLTKAAQLARVNGREPSSHDE